MVDAKVIDLSPQYQRRERWSAERQSELIESFLLNVPVPPLYLAEEDYGNYSIIDGKQRITAVTEFLNGNLALKGVDSFSELIGLKFKELPRTLQNALRIRPYFRVITLLKQSNPKLKYEVFLRLNRSGVQLNPQEIRNVAFRGKLNNMIYGCGKNKFLKLALKIEDESSPAFQQMQDAEFVLRYLALYKNWVGFAGGLSRFMDDFMIRHQDARESEVRKFKEDFEEAIERVHLLWGNFAFQRWDGTNWRKQALAGLWDAQMIAVSLLSKREFSSISGSHRKVIQQTKELCKDPDFEKSVRMGTNIPSLLRLRVEMTHQLLVEI